MKQMSTFRSEIDSIGLVRVLQNGPCNLKGPLLSLLDFIELSCDQEGRA